jgi:hypothetical protein
MILHHIFTAHTEQTSNDKLQQDFFTHLPPWICRSIEKFRCLFVDSWLKEGESSILSKKNQGMTESHTLPPRPPPHCQLIGLGYEEGYHCGILITFVLQMRVKFMGSSLYIHQYGI